MDELNEWPGRQPAKASYGHTMNFVADNKPYNLRQNDRSYKLGSIDFKELVVQEQSRYPGLRPINETWTEDQAYLDMHQCAFVPRSVYRGSAINSRILSDPDVFDPSVDQKICGLNNDIVWADRLSLKYFNSDNSLVKEFNVGSQVSCISSVGDRLAARTKLGLAMISHDTVDYVAKCDAVHNDISADGLYASIISNCRLQVYDLRASKKVYSRPLHEGVLGSWSMSKWATADRKQMWTNGVDLSMIDIRAPPLEKPAEVMKTKGRRELIRSFDVVDETFAYVLGNRDLSWYDTRMPSKAIVAVPHYFSRGEPSLRLTTSEVSGTTYCFVSAFAESFNTVFTFGVDEKFPVQRYDPYLARIWPTVSPQSQYLRPAGENIELFITTPFGGLYKETFKVGADENEEPEVLAEGFYREPEMPPPGTTPQVDFMWKRRPANSQTLRNDNMFRFVYETKQAELKPPELLENGQPALHMMNFSSPEDFGYYLHRIWLKDAPEEFQEQRSEAVYEIFRDVSGVEWSMGQPLDSKLVAEVADDDEFNEDWPEIKEPEERLDEELGRESGVGLFAGEGEHIHLGEPPQSEDGVAGSSQVSSTQETQTESEIYSSQPIPSSQTVPSLGTLSSQSTKKKRKSKKRRNRDGFS